MYSCYDENDSNSNKPKIELELTNEDDFRKQVDDYGVQKFISDDIPQT